MNVTKGKTSKTIELKASKIQRDYDKNIIPAKAIGNVVLQIEADNHKSVRHLSPEKPNK